MSNNVTMAAPIDYTTDYITNYTTNYTTDNRSDTAYGIASTAFTLASPPSPAPSLKRRRQSELNNESSNSDCEADDEEGSSESDSDSGSDLSDLEDEDKENVVPVENKENVPPPRKRLCFNLEDSPRLRAAELSSSSGRSSRASWTSGSASTYSLLTPPDSPRFVFRPLEIIEVDDDSEDDLENDVDVKEHSLFAFDIEGPPTSSDESSDSRGSVVRDVNDQDVHYTDSEVELKATTQHPLSFSSTEEEEESGEEDESGEEEGYGSEGEEYGDVEDEYENWGVEEEDDYEGEDEDEYNEEGYIELPNCVAVRVQHLPRYADMSGGFAMFAQQEVVDLSSAGGIVASSQVLYGIMNAQSFDVEEEL